MKQPVDSFFNKKLKNHSAEAPASAWDRIDANLSQKKKPVVWLKIAAGLSLLMVAGFIIYTSVNTPLEQIAEVKEISPVKTESPTVESTTPALPAQEDTHTQTPAAETSALKHPNKKSKIPEALEVHEVVITPVTMIAENSIDHTDYTNTIKENPIETKNQNTTIHISVEEANAKYLDEQFIADATPENKKPSKLRNLFEKAQEMDPIGEIRQLKNEVLALNFRNEKKGERNR